MRTTGREELDWWLQADGRFEDEARPLLKKKSKPKPRPAEDRSQLAGELYAEEAEYPFTYKASRHERLWLIGALGSFYEDSLISDVLRIVKGGKEANVYCCRPMPAQEDAQDGVQKGAYKGDKPGSVVGLDLLAAKVYRPRLLRQLRNDSLYKQGRDVLGDDGKAMRDGRSMRAIQKKTRIGSEMSITSWIEHEYQTLRRLHAAGADVPYPVAQSGNAILMQFIGDELTTAPTLSETRLEWKEARRLFQRVLRNIELMLANHLIHADLSAYNILYWEGQVTLIDFPQVVDPLGNPQGADLLARDVERVCQYFARYGLRANPAALASGLWGRYLRGELVDHKSEG